MAYKLLALLSLLAIAVSVSFADTENEYYYSQCQMEVQDQPIYSCQSCLQMMEPQQFSWWSQTPSVSHAQACNRCCQELQYTSPQCRCQAIRQMVSDIMGQGGMFGRRMFAAQNLRAKASQLPAMCGMSPQFCSIWSRDEY